MINYIKNTCVKLAIYLTKVQIDAIHKQDELIRKNYEFNNSMAIAQQKEIYATELRLANLKVEANQHLEYMYKVQSQGWKETAKLRTKFGQHLAALTHPSLTPTQEE